MNSSSLDNKIMVTTSQQSSNLSLLPFGKNSRILPIPKLLVPLIKEDESNRGSSDNSSPLTKTIKKCNLKENDIRFGRWDTEEHERFLQAMEKYGNIWRLVREHVGTRTEDQIRSHAQKYYESLLSNEVKRIKKNPGGETPIFAVVRVYYCTNGISRKPQKKLPRN
eukprot:TRINITY_DN9644_c0_g1_i2.p1 TRINITY_DN9644_c0_g1~~TRINITY_DN9644_c0_g1_i2.p1  ORF type:complete len:166 (-),score=4.95 TRINITY_DN9644_c0_g1_i2:154-651(-)